VVRHTEARGVTLRPDRWRAAGWTLVGVTATGLSAYAFGSSSWFVAHAVLLTLCALPTAVFGLQLLAPDTWTLHVAPSGVRGHVAAFAVDEPFHGLDAVDVVRSFGEPVLLLRGYGGRRRLLLPVGCDVQALRRVLADAELRPAVAG
jgi:hypothetical protein